LKQIKNDNVSNLEETFKPITEPLHEILTENKKLNKKNILIIHMILRLTSRKRKLEYLKVKKGHMRE